MPTSRGRYKTQRSAIDINGMSQSKEFVQRVGESIRAVNQRANAWQVEMRGKAPSPDMTLRRAIEIYLEYRKADLDEGIIQAPTDNADVNDSKNLKAALGSQKIGLVNTHGVDMALKALAAKKRTAKGM